MQIDRHAALTAQHQLEAIRRQEALRNEDAARQAHLINQLPGAAALGANQAALSVQILEQQRLIQERDLFYQYKIFDQYIDSLLRGGIIFDPVSDLKYSHKSCDMTHMHIVSLLIHSNFSSKSSRDFKLFEFRAFDPVRRWIKSEILNSS